MIDLTTLMLTMKESVPRFVSNLVWLLMLSSQCLQAQDPGLADTVYFGANGLAYGYPGDVYRVPVYIAADYEIGGLTLGMEFGLGDLAETWDSTSLLGSIFMEDNYLDFTGLCSGYDAINGFLPDTLLLFGASITKHLPPGRYLLCNVWFTGGHVGRQAVVDSACVPPGGIFVLATAMGDMYTPEFFGGVLDIVAGPSEIYFNLPDTVVGDAAVEIAFTVEAYGSYTPVTIVLDSMIYTGTGESLQSLPVTFGPNPLTVKWTPAYQQYGVWQAFFTATDAQQFSRQSSLLLVIDYVGMPCSMLYGDANCDDIINISDVIFLLNYIFEQGTPPGCGVK